MPKTALLVTVAVASSRWPGPMHLGIIFSPKPTAPSKKIDIVEDVDHEPEQRKAISGWPLSGRATEFLGARLQLLLKKLRHARPHFFAQPKFGIRVGVGVRFCFPAVLTWIGT